MERIRQANYSPSMKDWVDDARLYMADKISPKGRSNGNGLLDGSISIGNKSFSKKKFLMTIIAVIVVLIILSSIYHWWKTNQEEKMKNQVIQRELARRQLAPGVY